MGSAARKKASGVSDEDGFGEPRTRARAREYAGGNIESRWQGASTRQLAPCGGRSCAI